MNNYLRTIDYKYSKVKVCESDTPLSKRANSSKTIGDLAVNYFYDLQDEVIEKFIVIYLDNKNKIICFKVLFTGTVNSSAVHLAEIFRVALLCGATGFICIHNHTSGDTEPSNSDIETTGEIKKASKLMQIRLLDHIIIGSNKKYFSFADNGIL